MAGHDAQRNGCAQDERALSGTIYATLAGLLQNAKDHFKLTDEEAF